MALGHRKSAYVVLHDMITDITSFRAKEDFEEIYRFVESWGITSEECNRLEAKSPLCAAAISGSPKLLNYFISLGFDPNGEHNGDGQRPIHAACMENANEIYHTREEDEHEMEKRKKQSKADKLEVVRILVEDHNVDVNVTNWGEGKYTPLLFAAFVGKLEVVKLLVKAGADLDASGNGGKKCLHVAAMSGNPELCEYLLSLGLFVDVTDMKQKRPLHFAAIYGHVQASKVLLDAGADVNRQDAEECSPLANAFMSEDLDVIRLLCSRGAKPHTDPDIDIYFLKAVSEDQYDIVRYLLLEIGLSPNTEERHLYDATALSAAMQTGNVKVAKLLIACGCTIGRDDHVIDKYILKAGSEELKRLVEDVQKMSENPRRLEEICNFKIRSLLGVNLLESVNELPIPYALKDILLLKHI